MFLLDMLGKFHPGFVFKKPVLSVYLLCVELGSVSENSSLPLFDFLITPEIHLVAFCVFSFLFAKLEWQWHFIGSLKS
jgi:hypothetical protein